MELNNEANLAELSDFELIHTKDGKSFITIDQNMESEQIYCKFLKGDASHTSFIGENSQLLLASDKDTRKVLQQNLLKDSLILWRAVHQIYDDPSFSAHDTENFQFLKLMFEHHDFTEKISDDFDTFKQRNDDIALLMNQFISQITEGQEVLAEMKLTKRIIDKLKGDKYATLSIMQMATIHHMNQKILNLFESSSACYEYLQEFVQDHELVKPTESWTCTGSPLLFHHFLSDMMDLKKKALDLVSIEFTFEGKSYTIPFICDSDNEVQVLEA